MADLSSTVFLPPPKYEPGSPEALMHRSLKHMEADKEWVRCLHVLAHLDRYWPAPLSFFEDAEKAIIAYRHETFLFSKELLRRVRRDIEEMKKRSEKQENGQNSKVPAKYGPRPPPTYLGTFQQPQTTYPPIIHRRG